MQAVVITIAAYFALLMAVSRIVGRKATNFTFFQGERRSPWPMVAFGMVGASISGVTVVSVPGMVLTSAMTYLQLCLGFILGYVAVAFVLLPVYYRLNLTTIYTYLDQRLGRRSYLTGALFFLLSKLTGSAVKFYVVCLLLQHFVGSAIGIPFWATAVGLVVFIWLYTRRGGVRTLVFTDTVQTLCLVAALVLMLVLLTQDMGLTPAETVQAVAADARSRIFVTGDLASPQHLLKMLLSGAFIVVAMTGLDQDMMQKNLTCRTLREAQKNMCVYGVAFVPVNLLFLALGVLVAQWMQSQGMDMPAQGDQLLPLYVESTGSTAVLVLFTLGIVAASLSTADSALTALTTSFCVDVCRRPNDELLRQRAHLAFCALFALCILAVHAATSTSLIDAIYTMVSYTYGPLLGLFAYGLFTRRSVTDALVPVVCVASPLLCFAIDRGAALMGYRFGYELLLLNGMITFAGLLATSRCRVHNFLKS